MQRPGDTHQALAITHTAFLERGGGGGGERLDQTVSLEYEIHLLINMGGHGKFSPEVVINSPLPPMKYTTTCTPTQELGIDLRVQ